MPSGSGISMLMALAAPATQHAEAGVVGEDAPHQGQQFAQFLSGFGMGTEGQGTPNFTRGGVLPGVASLLTAQELEQGDAVQLDMPQLADIVITPELAKEMGGQVEAMIRITQDPQQVKALTELKDQLQAIEQSGQQKTLSALVQAMSVPQHAKLAMQALRQFFASEKVDGQRASHNHGESPVQPDATAIGLSAAIFRSADGENSPATSGEDFAQAETGEALASFETVTMVQPLAATTTVSVAAPVEAVLDAPVDAVRDLDAAIPSLELDKSADALPDVTLPKMGEHQQQAATPTQTASQQATQAFSNYLAQQGADKSLDRSLVADSAAASAVDAIQSLHVGSHGAVTHAARTAQPATIDLMPTPGFYNRAPVSEQVHVAIHQAAKDGLDRITIQLDPVDLGRVEINMHRSQDGHTQISFMIDKPDTFDNLSRDARMLERTLQEAGIKADTGSMQFNLRQQPQPQLHSDLNGQQQSQHQQEDDDESRHASAVPIGAVAAMTRNYTVNIREGVDISA